MRNRSNKPVLFLNSLKHYTAIKIDCSSSRNLGSIGVSSGPDGSGILNAKKELCDLIDQEGGNLISDPSFIRSLKGKTSRGQGSGYIGWKNFGSLNAALRYLGQYFEIKKCENNFDLVDKYNNTDKLDKKSQNAEGQLNQVQVLAQIGFKDAAQWTIVNNRKIVDSGDDPEFWKECKETLNSLYAFCVENKVFYVGKTARTLEKRFVGYRDPGNGQATNKKCHKEIRRYLTEKKRVRIMVFPDLTHLHWGSFRISLAAGLEDAIIDAIKPELNGTNRKNKSSKGSVFLTESAFNEASMDRN